MLPSRGGHFEPKSHGLHFRIENINRQQFKMQGVRQRDRRSDRKLSKREKPNLRTANPVEQENVFYLLCRPQMAVASSTPSEEHLQKCVGRKLPTAPTISCNEKTVGVYPGNGAAANLSLRSVYPRNIHAAAKFGDLVVCPVPD